MQNVNYDFSLFAIAIVYNYLDNSDMPMTLIAGIYKELFVLVSKNDTSSKFDFFICGSYFKAKFCILLPN